VQYITSAGKLYAASDFVAIANRLDDAGFRDSNLYPLSIESALLQNAVSTLLYQIHFPTQQGISFRNPPLISLILPNNSIKCIKAI
jgi:hypothetical protein